MRSRRRFKLCITLLAYFAYCFSVANCLTRGVCKKNIDCNVARNEKCVLYDFYNQPAMWPACPKVGSCACIEGTALVGNGSCVPYVNLNYNDTCRREPNEQYLPMYTCISGPQRSYIGCNSPNYIDKGGYCEESPKPFINPTTPYYFLNFVVSNKTRAVATFLDQCGLSASAWLYFEIVCNSTQGLVCRAVNRAGDISNSNYGQCQCADVKHVFDFQKQICRLRGYGDACLATEDCNTGLLGPSGTFECRLGRCRCFNGYEPYDLMTWDYAKKFPVWQRICVITGATTWIPTGHTCTMNPQKWTSSKTLRLCHSRAFCHLCHENYVAANNASSSVAVVGVCRELACAFDEDCLGSNAFCSRWDLQIDPPCENGMCDCQFNRGFYKDRFSRCSPYRMLQLGDRCIPGASLGLHPWFQVNEDWDVRYHCMPDNRTTATGFVGYSWGTVKCKPPYQEDVDGSCIINEQPRHDELNVNETCDETDIFRRFSCNITKGLKCRRGICECDAATIVNTTKDTPSWVGCNAPFRPLLSTIWDGLSCRLRRLNDGCRSESDCNGGSCINATCRCPNRLILGSFNRLTLLDNSEGIVRIGAVDFCFNNYTLVDKGAVCHLDPISWDCSTNKNRYSYGFEQNYILPMVCKQPFVCLRCPADFNPEDENRGICRAFTRLEDPYMVAKTSLPAFQISDGTCDDYGLEGWTSLIPTPSTPRLTADNLADSLRISRFGVSLVASVISIMLPLFFFMR